MTTKQQAWRHLANNIERLKAEGPLPPVTVDCAIYDLREAADALDRVESQLKDAEEQKTVALDLLNEYRMVLAEAEAEIKVLKSPKPRPMGVEYMGTNASHAGECEGEG